VTFRDVMTGCDTQAPSDRMIRLLINDGHSFGTAINHHRLKPQLVRSAFDSCRNSIEGSQ